MSTILERVQRVLQTIAPYSKWVQETSTNKTTGPAASSTQQTPKPLVPSPPYAARVQETSTNETKGPAASAIQQTPKPFVRVPSYRDDIQSFGERMMTHIQSGALTQEALEKAIQARDAGWPSKAEQKSQEILAEVDREIETVYQSLPESQRQRFTENVDRQARINARLEETPFSDFIDLEKNKMFSWQTDLVAKLMQDPELEKLAESIRTKEPPWGYPETDQSSVDEYYTSPLGGPFVALRVQQAAKSPATLQTFVNTLIKRNRGILRDTSMDTTDDIIAARHGSEKYIHSREDKHTVDALLKTGYTPVEISSIICNALMTVKIPIYGLTKYKLYSNQLSPEDTSILKTHYIQEFAEIHVINSTTPVDSVALFNLETFLKDPYFVNDAPRNPFLWKNFNNHAAEFGPIADVLLQAYDIDTVVPILEAYQGNRALEGNLSAKDMVSDVRAYLNERTNKNPTTPEVNSDLQLN